MPLQPQTAEFIFDEGMSEAVEGDVQVSSPTLIQNGEFNQRGAIAKRKGLTSLDTQTDSSWYSLISNGKQTLVLRDDVAYPYTAEYGLDDGAFNEAQEVLFCEHGEGPKVRVGASVQETDVAYYQTAGGEEFYCIAYSVAADATASTNNRVQFVVINKSTGGVLYRHGLINSAFNPKVEVCGDSFLVFFRATNDIKAIQVDMSTSFPTVGGVATVHSGMDSSNKFDTSPHPSTSHVFVAFKINASETVRIDKVDETGSSVANTTQAAAVTVEDGLAVHCDDTNNSVWVAFKRSSGAASLDLYDWSDDLLTLNNGPTTIGTAGDLERVGITDGVTAGSVVVVYGGSGTSCFASEVTSAHSAGTEQDLEGLLLSTKPFMANVNSTRTPMVGVRRLDSDSEPHLLIIEPMTAGSTNQPNPVCMALHDVIDTTWVVGHLHGVKPMANTGGSTNFILSHPVRTATTSTSSDPDTFYNGADTITMGFDPTSATVNAVPRAQLENTTYFGGGLLRAYDGERVLEAVPFYAPQKPTVALSGTGITGTFTYKVVFSYVDNQGNLHRTAPSATSASTSPSNQTVDVTMEAHIVSDLGELDNYPWRGELYRTADSGSTFFLLHSFEVDAAGTYTYADSTADATLIQEPVLYTTGGVLPNEPVPAPYAIATSESRVALISSQDRRKWYFSKEKEEGVAAEFHNTLTGRVSDDGGDLTAIASLDDKWVLFQRENILVVSGVGPNSLGEGAFSVPERVADGIGCVDRNSVVNLPQGLLFRADSGFHLLGRDLSVSYIGEAINEQLGTNTVQRAMVVENKKQVWFLLQNSKRVLVLDYRRDAPRWYRFDYNPTSLTRLIDMAYVNQTPTFIGLVGTTATLYEVGSTYADDGAFYDMQVDTPWFKGGGHMGAHRLWKLHIFGSYKDVCTLRAEEYVQGPTRDKDTLVRTSEWVEATIDGLDPVDVESHMKVQKATAHRFSIQVIRDSVSAQDDSEAMELYGYRLDYGVLQGPSRKGATIANNPVDVG